MKKLRSNAYRVVLAATVLLAALGILLGSLSAMLGEEALLGWAVALVAGAIAGLAVAFHFRTGHILRAAKLARPAATPTVNATGLVAIDNTILTELQELRKSVKLSLNNEMFLLDEIQRLNAHRTDDH